jgi:lysophospholipase L1-like esterase
MRPTRANILVACVTTLAALGAAEAFLSFAHPEILPYRLRLYDPNLVGENYLEYGDRIPFRLRSNYNGSFVNGAPIRTDVYGLRRTATPIKDHADVLCLGDSFTFGYLLGDQQTYPAALQQIMDAERTGLVVANGGYAGGFGFDGAYVRYAQDLHKLGPRLVIVGVYPGNDYQDFASDLWTEVADDGSPLRIANGRQIVRRWIYAVPILRESRLWVGLGSAFLEWKMRDRIGDAIDHTLDWSKVETLVRSFATSTRSHGAALVFLFLREPGQVYAGTVADRKAENLDQVRREVEASNQRLKEILKANGVPWLDDGALLEEAKQELRNHVPPRLDDAFAAYEPKLLARVGEPDATRILAASDSIHYSWLTNVLLAQWLFGELHARDLLPGPPAPAG